ncbi:MAG: ATP-dependent DNA helicase [Candidatus Cloacimonadales bacterium]
MKPELNIAIRELAEFTLQSGDLNLESFAGTSRAQAGIRAHQKIQKSRPAEYSAEVSLAYSLETDKLILQLAGRVDGIYTYPDKIIIDEIKSTTKSLDNYALNSHPIHWGQAQLYAYIYAVQNDWQQITVQLTYYQLDTRQKKELQQEFSRAELQTFFSQVTRQYLQWIEQVFAWQQKRDSSCSSLQFPFAQYRAGQREMAVQAFRTIRDGKQLLVQAPTGIGKTLATIFPAVKSFPDGSLEKIFYFAARTTGKNMAKTASQILQSANAELKTLLITAKDKICFLPQSSCNAKECKYARGYYDRVYTALQDIFQHNLFDRQQIETYAEKHQVCPFEFTLLLSLWCDLIICDYNYGFDPRVYLRRFFGEDVRAKNYLFLIDEAHNLVDRSREMFSASLSKKAVLEVRRPLKERLPKIYKALGSINNLLLQYRKQAEAEADFFIEANAPEQLYPLLKNFIYSAEKWLAQNIAADFRPLLLEFYFNAHWLARVLEEYDQHYITTFSRRSSELIIKLFCVDPSAQMKTALERCRAAIFFSATLTPEAYFSQLFGCAPEAEKKVLASPFPAENLLVCRADISTRYKDRQQTARQLAQILAAMSKAKKGNYLFFFPSYKYLQLVSEIFIELEPEIKIQMQTAGLNELEREEFIENFQLDAAETLVGFAVMGGVFGEGIDLVGERLDGVALVGVGLPGLSDERNLIRDYHDQENLGFEYAYQYPGINRVLQAAGRVIRTQQDRGVVLLIDDRFRWSSYRKLLPKYWKIRALSNPAALPAVLKKFWKN